MEKDLYKYIVRGDEKLLDTLKKINDNKQGFVIVIDQYEKVIGVLTDGDIRRAMIRGAIVDDTISNLYTCNPCKVRLSEGFEVVTELFKNQAIKFLPIVDDNERLVNIITKSQLHAMLLQDIHSDLNYDFLSLDAGVIDHEIYTRPWGYYKTTVLNEYFQSKIISIKPREQLSLQSHNHREEHWIVVHGIGMVQLDGSVLPVRCGSTVFIPLGCKHRLTNTDDKESLIISEVQIGDYFGEDDIVRYEDSYGRC